MRVAKVQLDSSIAQEFNIGIMSEAVSSDDDSYFNQIKNVHTDPYITAVFAEVRTYNDLLATEPLDESEIIDIMTTLDRKWANIIQENAVVTGRLGFAPENLKFGEVVWGYYVDQDIQFNGIVPVPISMAIGDDGVERYICELQVQVIRETILDDDDCSIVMQTGRARIDELASIEFPHMMSSNRARYWLEYYHRDAIESIDVALLNPGLEECELASRLSDIEVNLEAIHGNDEDLAERSVQALTIYTETYIGGFDSEMNYDIVATGDCWVIEDGDRRPAEFSGEEERMPFRVSRVAWVPEQQNSHIVVPHVVATLITPYKDIEGLNVLIPLKGISEFRSHRYAYFNNYDN